MDTKITTYASIISILVSIIAIFISYEANVLSKQNLEYQQNYNSFINTPSLKEISDSTLLQYDLNNPNAELQTMEITFPSAFKSGRVFKYQKPIALKKDYLNILAYNYSTKIYEMPNPKDSVSLAGTISIPVMIDYNVILYGFPYQLRENRLLIFDFVLTEFQRYVDYSTSVLFHRYGYPLKAHHLFSIPFLSQSKEERIKSQDQKDVQNLLNHQLSTMNKIAQR